MVLCGGIVRVVRECRVAGRGRGVVSHSHRLIVESQPQSELPTTKVKFRAVVECHSAVAGQKSAIEEETIATLAREITPTILTRVVFVYIFEYELLDTRSAECYGSLHLLFFVEGVQTHQPTILATLVGAKNDIFGDVVLLLALFESEVIFGEEVVVYVHLIVEILIRCKARKHHLAEVVAKAQTLTHSVSLVGARFVVVYLSDQLLTMLFGVWRADIFVWVTTLLYCREGYRVVERKSTLAKLKFCADIAAILLVAESARIVVAVVSVVVGILTRNRESKPFTKTVVGRSRKTVGVARAILGTQTNTLIFEWREGVDIYHTTHCVATIEGGLRTTQKLYTLDVGEFGVVEIFVGNRNIIDIHTHHRLVDTGTHSSHID